MAGTDPLSTTYTYDPSTAELTEIDYSDATTDISFTYDRLGRRQTITDAAGSRTFGYTDSLQLATETITGLYDKTITRNYEESGVVGRPTGFSVGSDYSATYGHDAVTGRFASVSWDAGGTVGSVNYGYVPNSDLLENVTFSGGGLTTYGYESNRNLKTQVKNEFNSTLISQYDYSYDSIGRREHVKNAGSAFEADVFNIYGYSLISMVITTATN
jgi:YD repeat-containing protein